MTTNLVDRLSLLTLGGNPNESSESSRSRRSSCLRGRYSLYLVPVLPDNLVSNKPHKGERVAYGAFPSSDGTKKALRILFSQPLWGFFRIWFLFNSLQNNRRSCQYEYLHSQHSVREASHSSHLPSSADQLCNGHTFDLRHQEQNPLSSQW